MARGNYPISCRRCGNSVQPEDQFCGSCGAVVLSPPPQPEQVVPEPPPAVHAPTTRNNRTLLLAGVVSVLLLIVGGTVAYATLGPGIGLLGNSEPEPVQPTTTQETSEEDTQTPESTSVSPDSSPDPAFDSLLPPLKSQTTAPIMLPVELPNELENVGIENSIKGARYELTFLTTPPEYLVDSWPNAKTIGSFRAVPQSEFEPDRRFEATSTEDVELPDGTEAKLRYMEPVREKVMYGPRWEGTFYKNGYTYSLEMDDYGKEVAEQALSTMVLVRGAVDEPTTPQSPKEKTGPRKNKDQPSNTNASKAKAEEAAEDYYRAAGSQDFNYTFDNLDSTTKSKFTREEWRKKNQWFADNAPAIYNIESVKLDESSQRPLAEVEVRLTGEDGSSSIRNTYFVYEDGEWLHRFAQEEIDLFEPGVSFEEWLDD